MNSFASMCSNASLDQVQWQYEHRMISQVEYEAYCWLWENCAFRFGNNCSSYKDTDFTPLFKELMFELHGLIL